MDKTRLTLRETFASQSETDRKQILQRALDQHLYRLLNRGVTCDTEASEQRRLREEVQTQ